MKVITKQKIETNMTQPWGFAGTTYVQATRIHTSPPKICRNTRETLENTGPLYLQKQSSSRRLFISSFMFSMSKMKCCLNNGRKPQMNKKGITFKSEDIEKKNHYVSYLKVLANLIGNYSESSGITLTSC